MRAYEKLAAIWDGYGVKVTKPEQIAPAIRQGYASGKPAIINVEVSKVHASPVTEAIGFEFSKMIQE
jgi:thiamine pyrophosphate-dependent acetolactate synthase large subunit-like protein